MSTGEEIVVRVAAKPPASIAQPQSTVDRDGNVYFTDLVFQRIMKLTPKGVLTVFREGSNNANGMLVVALGMSSAVRRTSRRQFRRRRTPGTIVPVRMPPRRPETPTC